MNIKNKVLWTTLAVAATLLPVMVMRDFTPSNELRYLSIADEAIADGHLFTFTNHGVPYADKPPLYIWIVMAGRVLFGEHAMWFLSLFSLIPALVITWTMTRWVRPFTTENERQTAALMMMSCGLFLGLAVFLRMDMLMNMFITLALYVFYRMYEGDLGLRNRILFPAFVFMALFSKGPVGLLVPLVSTMAFLAVKRDLKSAGRYWEPPRGRSFWRAAPYGSAARTSREGAPISTTCFSTRPSTARSTPSTTRSRSTTIWSRCGTRWLRGRSWR